MVQWGRDGENQISHLKGAFWPLIPLHGCTRSRSSGYSCNRTFGYNFHYSICKMLGLGHPYWPIGCGLRCIIIFTRGHEGRGDIISQQCHCLFHYLVEKMDFLLVLGMNNTECFRYLLNYANSSKFIYDE